MKLDVPDDYVPLLITALEQYYAYTRAVKRDDSRYQQAADWFRRQQAPVAQKPVQPLQRKPPGPQRKVPPVKPLPTSTSKSRSARLRS
jgi:hypothetical protein